jgi:lipopolysaccharide assembly protein A
VKLRSLSRWIVGVPLLLLMVLFALSNSDPVPLGLFPLGRLPFAVPLSVVILAAMGLGFFLGGLRVWFTALHHRRAARRAEEAVRLLEARHQEGKARTSGPALTHTGATSRA